MNTDDWPFIAITATALCVAASVWACAWLEVEKRKAVASAVVHMHLNSITVAQRNFGKRPPSPPRGDPNWIPQTFEGGAP